MRLIKKTKKELHTYKNGNYQVTLFDDGTKIRETEESEFKSLFPESIDCKITNKCNAKCSFCHENSVPDGLHANLKHPFFKTLTTGTELAIGGGNIFEHPDIEQFLIERKEQGIICNITVNQLHFEENAHIIYKWQKEKLVYGVGISYNGFAEDLNDLYFKTFNPENVVVHAIAGIHDLDLIKNEEIKVLILGYKEIRRGKDYFDRHNNTIKPKIQSLSEKLPIYLKSFKVLSFDNLAIKQLNVKDIIDPEVWERHYLGDDGQHTMYIDLVNEEFASSSTSAIRYNINEYKTIETVFNQILNEKN